MNLKQRLCNILIESNILQDGYIINHSYTNGLCGKNPNSRTKLEDYIESKNGIVPTLDTMQGGYRQPCIEESFVGKHYNNFINKKGYIPDMFNPYNETEIKDVAPTQSTQCGSTTSSASVLISEDKWSDLD